MCMDVLRLVLGGNVVSHILCRVSSVRKTRIIEAWKPPRECKPLTKTNYFMICILNLPFARAVNTSASRSAMYH
jgi:hypothetical protein